MEQKNENFNPLMQILDVLSTIDVDLFLSNDDEDGGIVERGLPLGHTKKEIENRLIKNQKKKLIIRKLDDLKDVVQQNDETNGIKILASLINDILEPEKREMFLSELTGSSCYGASIKLPIQTSYNENECHLIHKGIDYCRILLKRFNETNDCTMIKELTSKEIMNIVLTEQIKNDRNYISILVDSYPRSMDEIKFLIQEERDLMLKSSIFAHIGIKNIQELYNFLVELSMMIDKNELSRACLQSEAGGKTLKDILNQNYSPDQKLFADKISKFLARYG